MISMFQNLKRKYIKYKLNKLFQEFIESLENHIKDLTFVYSQAYDNYHYFIDKTDFHKYSKDATKYGIHYSIYLDKKESELNNKMKELGNEVCEYVYKLYDTRIIYYNWVKEFDTREFKFNEVLQIISKHKMFRKYNILSLDWMKIV